MVMFGLYGSTVTLCSHLVQNPSAPPRPVIGPSTNRQQQNGLNGKADPIREENDRVDCIGNG